MTEWRIVRPATKRQKWSGPTLRMASSYDRRTVTNTARFFRTKDGILVVVSKATSLFDESGRKTVRVGLVVDQLSVDVVEDVPGVLQSRGAAEYEVTNSTEEGLRSLCGSLEVGGSIYFRDVLLESLSKRDTGSVHNPWPRGKNVVERTGQSVQGSRERSFPGSTVSIGTYWYPPRGAVIVVSLARVILFFWLGG